MGRLDDAAKRKVVELRQAGLSFRKIKAVLELENIKVSAQAIYLFLKEFQGKVRPEEAGPGGAVVQPSAEAGTANAGRQTGWTDQQLCTMMREGPRGISYAASVNSVLARTRDAPTPLGSTGTSGTAVQDEEGIRIVSVTSLARGSQPEGGPQAAAAGPSAGPSTGGAAARRKILLSPVSNCILAARRRLLDKALLHKARIREMVPVSGQPVAALCRRDLSCQASSEARKVSILTQSPSFGLNPPRPALTQRSRPGAPAASPARRMFQQRAGLSFRSLHPPLQRDPLSCAGVRGSNPVPSPPAAQGTSMSGIRAQQPPNQPPSATPQKQAPEPVVRCGLQDQVQTLGAELRNLGAAMQLLAEQQGRLEREQAAQTQVQRQILSTLQGIASRLGPAAQHHSRTPPPPGSSSYSQSSFVPTSSNYSQGSPAQSKSCAVDSSGLCALETFKLTGLSPQAVNGFPSCSSDAPPLSTAATFSQSQTHTVAYTQSQATAYSQSYKLSCKEERHPEPLDPLHNCSLSARSSTNAGSPVSSSPQDPQFTIVKAETL
ncbi:mediator of RNA polymerase II transcription subunit 15-like [Scleropages formosus]|uniref:Mediator of RNA polymerase II transcription subunit 15-like n=1 Tax=Scleropages formosus TaxID=113540 RepID=A0A0P7UHH7_SCLFO|nr:mediator of RNA polymerase II transcription subunit 15-like [Scleropages formosus]